VSAIGDPGVFFFIILLHLSPGSESPHALTVPHTPHLALPYSML
jgi:hypothetical protein